MDFHRYALRTRQGWARRFPCEAKLSHSHIFAMWGYHVIDQARCLFKKFKDRSRANRAADGLKLGLGSQLKAWPASYQKISASGCAVCTFSTSSAGMCVSCLPKCSITGADGLSLA